MNLTFDYLDCFELEVTNSGDLSYINLKDTDFVITVKHKLIYEKLFTEDPTLYEKYEITYNLGDDLYKETAIQIQHLRLQIAAILIKRFEYIQKGKNK